MKLLARQRRFWHCLVGTFYGHCMTDSYHQGVGRFWGREFFYQEHVEMGCTCGRIFWRKDDK